MHVSFDLDSTLIAHGGEFEVEPVVWWARRLGIEPLRARTRELVRELQRRGHTVSVYTTSFRSAWRIRATFVYHGLRLAQVISEQQNQATLSKHGIAASKYPPAYGFDVHVDDSRGVAMEGKNLGFEVIVVRPEQEDWREVVLEGIARRCD